MANITHGTWIKDCKAIDAAYQDGVKVYGRNLALRTATPFTMIGENKDNQGQIGYEFSRVIPRGTVVAISYDITSSTGVGVSSMMFSGLDSGSTWQNIYYSINLSSGTKHVFVTLTTDSGHLHMTLRLDNATGTVTISNFIISESSTEVAWSPAPEDILN